MGKFLKSQLLSHRSGAGLLIAGVALGVVVGGAVGVIAASPSRTVTVCANKATNVLRYARDGRCVTATEVKVVLNQSGATGPRGATGPAGATGPRGAAGSSFTELSICGSAGTALCAVGVQGPGGGTVFLVDTEGRYSDFDYLEAAPSDADSPSSIEWSTDTNHCGLGQNQSCRTNWVTTSGESLKFFAIGTGRAATEAIVARHDVADVAKISYAAGVADAYVTPTASDWWLPSQDELTLMYNTLHLEGLGGFSSGYYWTASEIEAGRAWALGFEYGNTSNDAKINTNLVRAVRGF